MLFLMVFVSTGCAEKRLVTYNNGQELVTETVKPYGVFHMLTDDGAVEGVDYDISPGNIAWSVILSGTVVVPVILLGLYLWEPQEPA